MSYSQAKVRMSSTFGPYDMNYLFHTQVYTLDWLLESIRTTPHSNMVHSYDHTSVLNIIIQVFHNMNPTRSNTVGDGK